MKRWVEQPNKIKIFCEHIELGMSFKRVCEGMCIHPDTVRRYIRDAELSLEQDPNADTPECRFYRAYKKAEDDFEIKHLTNIKNFADAGDWKASAWLLERRRQQDYVVRAENDGGQLERITINFDVKREDA